MFKRFASYVLRLPVGIFPPKGQTPLFTLNEARAGPSGEILAILVPPGVRPALQLKGTPTKEMPT